MAYTFKEIMDYKPKHNQDVHDEIKSHLPDLIPFVGAGLTAFAYGTWTDALKTLTGYISDTKTRQNIQRLIRDKNNDNHLLEAAQEIENVRSPSILAGDLVNLFSAKKLEGKRHQLSREAISLLPDLFPNLVLTTNFDQTLETVYQESGHPFAGVFHPGHTELLRPYLRAGGVGGLMKLHGTITGPNIEYGNIVFTENQYKLHYGENSPLVADLTACFRQRIMLFLGCSLEKDRTMTLLRQIRQPGEYNYAIVSCPKSKRDARIRELGELGIRAIVYEEGRHEAVRVILEQLLADTQPDVYQRLPVHVGKLDNSSIGRFSPKDGRLPLIGREKELTQLQEFLGEPNIAFRWWAIVGPGGSGKTRLAYELQQQLPSGWNVQWLTQGDYRNLSGLTSKLTHNTLLIADYVQRYAQELGKWMRDLAESDRGLPLRLLLVERDSSQAQESFSWENSLHLGAGKGKLNPTRFAPFLALQPLEDSKLGEIMAQYADKVRGKTLPEAARDMLLDRLHIVDPHLQRPLYALFLTDAWVEAPGNPEQWDREKILQYITGREQERPIDVIRNTPDLAQAIRVLEPACVRLYTMATVWQDALYAQLKKMCLEDWQTVTNYATNYGKPEELLQFIGLGNRDGVDAMRPDLVGEYFVLSWLMENKDQAEAFLQTAWQNPEATVVFLNRVIHDYAHLLNESPDSWQLFFPDIRLESPDAALWAARLLINAIGLCTIPAECARLANQQEAIADAHPGVPEIAIEFANGLFNLANKQDAHGAEDTINYRLEPLMKKYSNVPEIAIVFAKGLFNLSNCQDVTGRAETVNRLEQLAEQHPDIPEIAIQFANGLFNLAYDQDATGAADTINRLEQLMSNYPDVPEIANVFASGLVNLACDQDAAEAAKTVRRLEQLVEQHSDIPEIAIDFAQGLVNLAYDQDAAEAAKTVRRLKQLSNDYPDIPEITIEFAKGLVNLSYHQDATEAAKTVHRLEQLMNDHPDISEIAIEFASGLVNLTRRQDATGAADTVNRLEQLTKKHSDILEIAIDFAKGLFNLSIKQDVQGRKKTSYRLEQLTKEHPDIPGIAIAFAQGLYNLSIKQDATGRENTIQRLEQLADGTIPVPDIAAEFAQCNLAVLTAPDKETAEAKWSRIQQIRADLDL